MVQRIVRFRVCGRQHEEYADDHRVAALVVFARGLFFGIAAGEATGEVHDLRKGGQYFDLRNVGRLRIIGDLLDVWIQKVGRGLIISLTENIRFMQSSGSQRHFISGGSSAVGGAEQKRKDQSCEAPFCCAIHLEDSRNLDARSGDSHGTPST